MKAYITITVFATALLFSSVNNSYAQKATEIYIPIGQSPGLSGHYAKIGTITSVDKASLSFLVTDSLDNIHTVMITDSTRIWLDKSNVQERNTIGSYADIQTGRIVEVKYFLAADSTYSEAADWVKVQITQ